MADTPIKFKPFRADLTVIDSLAAAGGVGRPDIARQLISEAIKARNLKRVGKDESLEAVVRAQKQAMTEVLAPLFDRVNDLGGQVSRFETRVAGEFENAGKQVNFLVLCARFIVHELLLVRLLLRDYVHTVYTKFVASVGQSTKDIESNFEARVERYRVLADGHLDELTEAGVAPLHDLAAAKNVLRDE